MTPEIGHQDHSSSDNPNAQRQARFVDRQKSLERRSRRFWLTDDEYETLKLRLSGRDLSQDDFSPGSSLFPRPKDERLKARGHYGLLDLDRLANNPPEVIDYVLPNMIAGSVGALVSPGGVGKSMLALQVAAQIAGGPDLIGVGCLPTGPVIYLPAEDPPAALHHRFHALAKMFSQEQKAAVVQNLMIQPLIGSSPNLLDEDWFGALSRAAWGRRLIILDTLRRFHSFEENASGPMAEVVGRMEAIAGETGCSIIFLHHASKGAALNGLGDQQQASRGSSVLTDNVRWQAYLAGMTTSDAQEWGIDPTDRYKFVRFGLSKINYGQPFCERWCKRIEGGVLTVADLGPINERTGRRRGNF